MSIRFTRHIGDYYLYIYIILALFVGTYSIYKIFQVYDRSLFHQQKDRINIVIYGQNSAFYSLDAQEARHYVMYFPADLKMDVPGGYGSYRVGSLGKLAGLDNNSEIFRKTFAFSTTAFVNYYFYEDREEVFYGNDVQNAPSKPTLSSLLFYSSNVSLFDRLFIVSTVLGLQAKDFTVIDYREKINKIKNDIFFQDETFKKESIGLLFQKQFRNEQKSVQIVYDTNYQTALHIGSLLEGNGIRVNDLSIALGENSKCAVKESGSGNDFSKTGKEIAAYFNCPLQKGKTDVYDILFILGNLEEEWEVN